MAEAFIAKGYNFSDALVDAMDFFLLISDRNLSFPSCFVKILVAMVHRGDCSCLVRWKGEKHK